MPKSIKMSEHSSKWCLNHSNSIKSTYIPTTPHRFWKSQEIVESIEANPQLRDFLMPENPGIEDLPLSVLKFPGNYQIGWKTKVTLDWAHLGLPNYQLGRPPGRLIGGVWGGGAPPGNKKFGARARIPAGPGSPPGPGPPPGLDPIYTYYDWWNVLNIPSMYLLWLMECFKYAFNILTLTDGMF